eukprot:2590370-Pyramimonas_sp.AAC.1
MPEVLPGSVTTTTSRTMRATVPFIKIILIVITETPAGAIEPRTVATRTLDPELHGGTPIGVSVPTIS